MTHHVTNYPPQRFFSERYRSSGVDGLAIWFAPFGAIYVAAVLLSGIPHPTVILLGGALVIVSSSLVHDGAHMSRSWAWTWPATRGIALRHLTHHRRMGRNFGILTDVWDRLFGTYRAADGDRPSTQDTPR